MDRSILNSRTACWFVRAITLRCGAPVGGCLWGSYLWQVFNILGEDVASRSRH